MNAYPESLRDGVDVLEGYNWATIDRAGTHAMMQGKVQYFDFKEKLWRPLRDSNTRHQV